MNRIEELDHMINLQLQLIKQGCEEMVSDDFIKGRISKIKLFSAEKLAIKMQEEDET